MKTKLIYAVTLALLILTMALPVLADGTVPVPK